MFYYSYNIGDFISATHHLDLEEDAIYRRLLDLYYLHEEPFRDDIKAISRSIRCKGKEDIVLAVLSEFFTLDRDQKRDGDVWSHSRCDEEIQKFRDKSEKASRSSSARWNKTEGKAKEMRSESDRIPDGMLTNNQEPITNNHNSLSVTVTPDWIPPSCFIEYVAENAMVTEKFVIECLVGFSAHFNGRVFSSDTTELAGELIKWTDRERKFRKGGKL